MSEFRALGGISFVDGDRDLSLGGPRQRRLAAILLIQREQVVSSDHLAEIVFAGEPTDAARGTLRTYVARLRRVVEANGSGVRILTRAPGYVLEVGADGFDVLRFEHAVETGRAQLAAGEADAAADALRAGLALWRGAAYAEFGEEEWAQPEAQRLDELRLVAHELLADADLACGRSSEVAARLEVLTVEHPLRESFQAKLMLALYRSGRQVDALRAYQTHRQVLSEELGLEPASELAELEARILAHDEALELDPGEPRLRGYVLDERLGTGREGTVHAAHLPGVDRDLVVRAVPEHVANDPDFVRTFDPDARIVASLPGPAVVPVQDWWREPGAAFIVMQRMRGGSLRDRLERGAVPAAEVAVMVGRVGAALSAAAAAGMAHGRVAAESILFDRTGDAYLADLPIGTRHTRPAGADVRDLAAVVDEALSGTRDGAAAGAKVPAAVAVALTAARTEPSPPPMDEFVATVVGALSDTTAEPIAQPVNPYKGLRAFDEPDAADFFGRERLVDDLVARLTEGGAAGRLVLVVGGSGSGKSSLVRAGLLPRLRSGVALGAAGWFVATMVPGHSPFKELAESLRRVAVTGGDGLAAELADGTQGIDQVIRRVVPAGGDLLLVVDQLEELFTLADKGEQRAFLDGLVHAVTVPASRLRVVATLRADFYDRPLRFERFASAIANSTVPIAAMSAAELDAAIVGPAERVGGRVEPALAAELVGAVLHEPAALPSLQFTLYELAARSPSGHLTLAGYRALGGVDAAIAARAEELYTGLDDPAREGIRRLFERLVVVSADGEPTRRRALRSELAVAAGPAGVEILPVIEAWAQSRLLTLDHHPETREPTVEVAHEALLREWPRLRGWLEEDREAIVALGHLREAAASWLALERDPGALYRGARLEGALQLVQEGARNLPAQEREFVEASLAERERERQHELEQLQHTVRANRRLRVQLAALAVALVVALVIGAVAVSQRNRASQERQIATARELAAAANANLEIDPERSVLLALAAVDRARAVGGSALRQAEQALHEALYASHIEQRFDGVGGAVAWSPDGNRFAASTADGAVEIRDRATGEVVQTVDAHDDRVNGIAFSPDGTLLGTTSEDDTAKLWDLATGDLLHRFDAPDSCCGNDSLVPSFSPDGTRFAFSWWTFERAIWVVDVASGQVVQEIGDDLGEDVGNPASTSFNPDGTMMAVATGNDVAVVDVASGERRLTLVPPDGATYAAWSPNGDWIALATGTGAYIFDAETGEERFSVPDIVGTVDLDWSADSTSPRLATASRAGTITVWRILGRGALEVISLSSQATRAGVAGLAFSPDGLALVAGAVDYETTLVWDTSLASSTEVAVLPGRVVWEDGPAAFTPDGRYIITGSPTGVLTVWDAQTYEPVRTLGGPAPGPDDIAIAQGTVESPIDSAFDLFSVAVSPDGSRVAALAVDNATAVRLAQLRVWDLGSWEEPFRWSHEGWVDSMAWSPDGEHLALSLTENCCAPDRGGQQGAPQPRPWDDEEGTRIGVVRVLDRAGQEVSSFRDEDDLMQVLSLSFTPDGAQLLGARSPISVSAPFVGTATIWDWRAGSVERTIETGDQRVVLSPDGELMVSLPPSTGATQDVGSPVVDLWDFATGEHLRSLAGHSANVVTAAFSPDGSRLASGSEDGSVRIWDVSTGEQELELPGHARSVSKLAFSPDGTELMSVGEDGFIRVWTLDVDELVDIATRELTRNFTDDECRQYLHTERCPST